MPKNVTVQFDDGSAHVYNNVPDSISVDDVNARAEKEFGKSVLANPSLLHTAKVGLNAIYKGAAGGVDALLNTPSNILNLGKAATGTVLAAAGRPDLAPDITEKPDFARRGLEKVGLIRADVAPQSMGERIVDFGGQGVGGALISPSSSATNLAKNLALGGIAGASGQVAREAAGDNKAAGEIGAALASIGVPMAVSGLSRYGANQIAKLQEQKSANEAADAITKSGLEKGYVIPASENNPTAFNKILESVGGKAATRQEAELRNQEVTNSLVKKQLGIPQNKPITEETLNNLRTHYAAPYREIASIPPITTRQQVQAGINPVTNLPTTKFVSTVIDPAKVLEDLKIARANANDWWKAYARDSHPETKATAQNFQNEAANLESQLEQVAINSGKPKLVSQLRDARQKIAQSYSVEQALNVGTTNINARVIGRMRDRGVPLTNDLKLIGEFAQQNPLYTREASGVSTPGVNNLDAMSAGWAMATGNPKAGLITALRGPARALALSNWYQNAAAMPKYSPSMIANLLKGLSPQDAKIAAARAAMLQADQENQ